MSSNISTVAVAVGDAGVRIVVGGEIARITLTRPARRNALDTASWRALTAACQQIASNPTVRVVLLGGEGEHFCAGADIQELAGNIDNIDWMRDNQREIGRALDAYATIPQPVVAMVRGCCFGGGMALAASSDFVFASQTARFALTPAKLGLSYRLVDCLRLQDVVGARRVRELLLLARELDAHTACDWGFVNQVAEAASLQGIVEAQLAMLIKLSGTSQRAIKHNLLKIRNGATVDDQETAAQFAQAFGQSDFRDAASAFVSKNADKDPVK